MAEDRKKSAFKDVFTVELFSMALALFCLLSFVCLVSGDAIFGDLGLMVQRFYLGAFGYIAFPAILFFEYLGVKGVTGLKINNKPFKAVVIYALIYGFFAMIVLQTVFSPLKGADFGEYLSACYAAGLSLAKSTPGGVVAGVFTYPFVALLGDIGSYIFCALAVLGVSAWLFRTPISEAIAASRDNRVDKKAISKNKDKREAKKERIKERDNEENAQPLTAPTDGGFEQKQEERHSSLHISDEEFAVKTERDKRKKEKEYSLHVLFGGQNGSTDNSLDRRDNPVKNSYPRSYQQSYDDDMREKTDYIRRPYDPRGFKVSSPMGNTSDEEILRGSGRAENMNLDVSEPEKDIYVINDGGRERPGIGSFDRASGRDRTDPRADMFSSNRGERDFGRDGRDNRNGFSSPDDEYNKDRFSYPDDSADDFDRNGLRNDYMRSGTDRDLPGLRNSDDMFSSNRGGNDFSERTDFSRREQTENFERDSLRSGEFDGENSRERDPGQTRSNSVLRRLSKEGREDASLRRNVSIDSDGENLRGGENLRRENTRGDFRSESFGEINRGFERDADALRGNPNRAEQINRTETFITKTEHENIVSERVGDNDRTNRLPVEEKPDIKVEFEREEVKKAEEPENPIAEKKRGFQISMEDLSDDRKLENPIEHMPKNYRFSFPPYNLLNDYKQDEKALAQIKKEQNDRCETILSILNNPNIDAQIANVCIGPAITRFEITIPPKVQMKRVTEKYEDINLWMAAKDKIRISAPITGTSRIGIEVPNSTLSPVGLKSVLAADEFRNAKKGSLCFGLGKDLIGRPVISDISKMPHLMVAGATGTGKSVFLNTLLVSLIYKYSPEDLRIVLVDPKFVEFSVFRGMPQLMFDEIFYDTKKACAMLDWAVNEMERRYQLFLESLVRDIDEYNTFMTAKGEKKLFKILIIIDEFADLMSKQEDRKNMENAISRLAAKARAAGIHLILATQRPSADIVDGSIKTNFTSRIAFKMSSQTDAMVIMGEAGAEKLLGAGDMLYRLGKMSSTERAQGAYITLEEVSKVCNYVKDHNKCYYDEFALDFIKKSAEAPEAAVSESAGSSADGGISAKEKNDDELLKSAMRIAITSGSISISMLQRRLGVGYPKAGKLVDTLVAKKYISEAVDNKARKILMTAADFEQVFGEPL